MVSISTTSGHLTVVEVDGVIHARGIPYANARRYQNPTPVTTAGLSRDATRRGTVCFQSPSRLDSVTGPIVSDLKQSEDCLVLSVAAPVAADGLPVMVWFHGGAYMSGGGEAPKYDPDPLTKDGVVVVNVTYRLGGFGYLTPTGSAQCNLGLKDQIEALRWVSANITQFGGNPRNVTVFGQSAGGDSVLSLIASDITQGLFHRAIVQSAPIGLQQRRSALHDTAQHAYTGHFTDDPSSAPASEVLTAQTKVVAALRKARVLGGMPFGPVTGQTPLAANFDAALRDTAPLVELLIGHTKDDAAPFVFMNPKVMRLRRFGAIGRKLTAIIVSIATRRIFGVDNIRKTWLDAGGHVATYRFDWAPKDGTLGACHCLELPFLFGGDWSDAPMLGGQVPPERLTATMRQTWTSFAKSGVTGLHSDTLVFS